MKKIAALFIVLVCIAQLGMARSNNSFDNHKKKSHTIFKQWLPQFHKTHKFRLPVIVYGPKEFERSKGMPKTEVDTFSLKGNSTAPYTMVVANAFCDDKEVTSATIKLNGVQIFGPLDFKRKKPLLIKTVTLTQLNTITVKIAGKLGTHLLVTILGKRSQQTDTTPPTLALTSPTEGLITRDSTIIVSGTATDQSAVTVSINGEDAVVGAGGEFSEEVLLAEGTNIINVVATDASNNSSAATRTVIKDATSPTLIVDNAQYSITNAQFSTISGTVADSTAVTLIVNGNSVPVTNGAFSVQVSLTEGLNEITVVATDAAGNSSTATRTIRKDALPPIVVISGTTEGMITNESSVTLSGSADDSTTVTVTVNGTTIPAEGGTFTYTVTLNEGLNTITVVVTDGAGNSTTITRIVRKDTTSPELTVNSPQEGTVVSSQISEVSGTVADSTAVTVTVNGNSVSVIGGVFSYQAALNEGTNTITIVATDTVENSTTVTRTLRRDSTPPTITVSSPANNFATNLSSILITGQVTDSSTTAVAINGNYITTQADGSFSETIILVEGLNTIEITATDAVGNSATETRIVRMDTQVPVISISSPAENALTNQSAISVTGTVEDSTDVSVTIDTSSAVVSPNGSFSGTALLNEGTNSIIITATDAAGNTATITRTVKKDSEPPVLTVTSPEDNFTTANPSVVVSGTVSDSLAVAVTINGTSEPVFDGAFTRTLTLTEGENTITITAMDAAGNSTSIVRVVTLQAQALPFTLTSPVDRYSTNTGDFTFEGTVDVDSVQRVWITYDGYEEDIWWEENGSFSYPFYLWYENIVNVLTLSAQTASGTVYEKTLNIIYDTKPPGFAPNPRRVLVTNQNPLTIEGYVDDLSPVTFTVNGMDIPVDAQKHYIYTVSLTEGPNQFELIVTDIHGQQTTLNQTIILDHVPPLVTLQTPANGDTTLTGGVWVEGSVSDDSPKFIFINNIARGLSVGGKFRHFIMLDGNDNKVRVRATDAAGNTSLQIERTIVNLGANFLPPDPVTVATPIDQTVPTSLASSTAFLYSGPNPVQLGVDSNTIEPERVAVLRGAVTNTLGEPLPGVRVSVLDHPEFGLTISRTDGAYDMAVNGGGILTVQLEKSGYLQIQRHVEVPWQDYSAVDTVVMTALDPVVTPIDFSAPIQVAQGSVVSDNDGPRQATMMFRQGTQAVMKKVNYSYQTVNENGVVSTRKTVIDTTEVVLNELHIRATEYTVGDKGREAMPAPLPPSSIYTYCVELTADEVVTANASTVTFTKPVPCYVDNFLNLPSGLAVPVGYYDRERGVWVATPDGITMQITSVNGGMAEIDLNGDGIPEAINTLLTFGFSEQELQKLGELYSPGKSLWRAEITHFSPHDWNYYVRRMAKELELAQAMKLNENKPKEGDGKKDPCDPPQESEGSIIGILGRTLGEEIPVTGTALALSYRSDRVPGNKRAYKLEIPLTQDTIPEWMVGVDVTVYLAGRTFRQSFDPDTHLTCTIAWDGRDAYGRELQGEQNYKIKREYLEGVRMLISKYPIIDSCSGPDCVTLIYPPGKNFGSPPRNVDTSLFFVARYDYDRFPIISTGTISTFNNAPLGFGKWSASLMHNYDPRGKTLYQGNGGRRDMRLMGPVITREMPADSIWDSEWDVAYTGTFAVGPDGSYYYFNGSDSYIYKKTRSGVTSIVAGTGISSVGGGGSAGIALLAAVEPGSSGGGFTNGDGGPATEAQIGNIWDIEVAEDGSIYFTEDDVNYFLRVRRIAPDGIITTIAAADSALITGRQNDPNKPVLSGWGGPISLGPNGTLYIVDEYVVRCLGSDGILRTIAGNGDYRKGEGPGTDGDGELATRTSISPVDIQVGKDGSLYILDAGYVETQNGSFVGYFSYVRKVTPDGIISTIAGSPGTTENTGGWSWNWYDDGNGVPAVQAHLGYTDKIALGPDGTVYVYHTHPHQWIRSITPDGIINTIAGTSISSGAEWGDGGSAMQAGIGTYNEIAVGPENELYVARGVYKYDYSTDEYRNSLSLRKIESANYWNSEETKIASEDGSLLYIFNSQGRHVRTEDALTGVTLLQFVYNESGLLTAVKDKDNLTTSIERNTLGNLSSILSPYGQRTTFTADEHGSIESSTNPAGETTHYTYTPDGLMTSLKDPKGNEHYFVYAPDGALEKDIDPAGGYKMLERIELKRGHTIRMTTAMGEKTEYTVQQLSTGVYQSSRKDASGLQTVSTFGLDGTITSTSPDGTVSTSRQGPDPRFGMMAPVTLNSTVTTPAGLKTVTSETRTISQMVGKQVAGMTFDMNVNDRHYQTVWDGMQRMFTSVSPEGRQTFTFIDTLGRVVKDSVPGILSVNYSYDSQGRVVAVTQGERTSTFAYDAQGRVYSATDPLQRTAGFAYDSVGRVLVQTLPDGKTIAYRYDANGNLLGLTPPEKPEHAFDYTVTDLTNQYTPSFAGDSVRATGYAYDLDKRITTTHLPNGDSITIIYAPSGCNCGGTTSRIASVTFNRGTQSFTYDAAGNLVQTIAASGDTLLYAYDGKLPKSVAWKGAVNGNVSITYDNNFRVTSQSVNGGNTVNFGYSNDGLLASLGAMSFTYSPTNGLPTGTTLGSVTTSQTYSNFGELASYEAKYNSTTLFNTSYTRDSLGRITTLNETVQGVAKTMRYGYDTIGRLEKVWRNDTLISQYGYDANGNRLVHWTPISTDSGTYDAQDRLFNYSNISYSYTLNGELSFMIEGTDTTRYTYDNFGNLIKVVLPNGDVIEYVIDGRNRRIAKKLNGNFVRRWLYAGQLSPVAELDSANNIVSRFTGSYFVKGGVTYRIVTDHLGSIRLVVNSTTGAIVQRLNYDEFGNVTNNSNPDFQPFGYAGGLYDSQTKLVRFGARDYDASVGRWTTKDPIGFGGGLSNVYEYVAGDPINFKDRSGLVKLHTGSANKKQVAMFSNAIEILKNKIKNNQSAKDYFKKFGIDIEKVLCPGEGPDVYLEPEGTWLSDGEFGYYNPITNNISLINAFGTDMVLAATLIHEMGHWSNDMGSWFGELDPDVSDIEFTNPVPDDGPYGYAAEVVVFGYIY